MDLSKSTEKLDKYYDRLNKGKTQKIKPSHVEKVIRKLSAKREMLEAERAESKKASKKTRLEGKIATASEQIDRATWLLNKISETDKE